MSALPGDFSQIRPGYTSSGTTGPIANNFPGYQTEGILNQGVRGYHFWDLLNTTRRNGFNACRDVGGTGQFGDGTFIPRPTGIDSATVYTDEHGEAILQFLPGRRRHADVRTRTAAATSVRSDRLRCSARRRSRPRHSTRTS